MLSVLINTQMLQAAVKDDVKRYFFASSACVYNADKQKTFAAPLLKGRRRLSGSCRGWLWLGKTLFGTDVPAFPGGFWAIHPGGALSQRIRPWGTWDGGRQKAPAAICRKVIVAKVSGKHEIEIWGTGDQTRSFMFIDDCIKGIFRIMNSEIEEPINLGSSEAVTVNELVDIVERIAEIKLKRNYNLNAPNGVNGPNVPLLTGLEKTYAWIYDQYMHRTTSCSGVVANNMMILCQPPTRGDL